MTRTVLFVSIVLFSIGIAAEPVTIDDLVGEDWYGLYLNGQKTGYAMTSLERNDDGQVVSREESHFKLSMGGSKQEMRMATERLYGEDGNLIRVTSKVDDGMGPKQFEAVVADGVLQYKATLGGQTVQKELPVPKDTLHDALKQMELIRSGEIGDEVSYSLFEPMYERELTARSTLLAVEERVFDGVKTKVFKVSEKFDMMGIESVAYVNEDGTVLEDVVGGIITMRLEPKEIATNSDYSSDVIIANAAYVNEPIRNARTRDSLKLRIEGPLGDEHLFQDDRQTFEDQNGFYVFESVEQDMSETDIAQLPVRDEAMTEYLQPSTYVQSDHPEVIAKARAIAGYERDAYKAADKLATWVHENMRSTYSASLTNCLEVLQDLEGDCTEHSILFVGLARAIGLPAGEVAGLIYVDSPEPGFYFHQWAKVWVGKWIDVDPTFGQTLADTTHVKLSEGDLFQQAKIVPVIGRIRISVMN